jgi:uncharacterized protein YfaS (alpha-2-macroglobulin family)
MTLYVLSGFLEAFRYGVEVPMETVSRALSYVNGTVPQMLKPKPGSIAAVAFAAYVLTSFPENLEGAKEGYKAARGWIEWLEKNAHSLTALCKAYLAHAQLKIGRREKAMSTLEAALDGAREDEITGIYFTPEKYSWLWYSDTIEKHAFLLRTLMELKPSDERIPGMVQWLLFNRKGNVWKSTKASAAAVYAILDYMEKTEALQNDEVFNISWGGLEESLTVKPKQALKDPLRWVRNDEDIRDDMRTALIRKEGPGTSFAGMTWTYTTDSTPEKSKGDILRLSRKYYLKEKAGRGYSLKEIKPGETVYVGDQIEVHLKANSKSRFEYVHVRDLKPAGFEAKKLFSGWEYFPLPYYEESRDSLTNFFIDAIPHGEFLLKYTLIPGKPGIYRAGAAIMQSMYAPEFSAHSEGSVLRVEKR